MKCLNIEQSVLKIYNPNIRTVDVCNNMKQIFKRRKKMSNQGVMSGNNESKSLKVKVQAFGRFLSGMVMPNIGAFIAWGFITALFIPTGWAPNETLSALVGPMITYLLPLLIGYTGGKLIAGECCILFFGSVFLYSFHYPGHRSYLYL